MTERIFRLRGDAHYEVQMNLPWFASGRLDPVEKARVEDHLKTCALCRDDLKFERWISRQPPEARMPADAGWAAIRRHIDAEPRALWPGWARATVTPVLAALRSEAWRGWALAAQFLVIVVLTGFLVLAQARPATYQALGAGGSGDGNLLVIFRPETSVADIARLLGAQGARIVDGPNPAGAYLLQTPPAQRGRALETLRSDAEILLAEPVDAGRSQ